MTRKQVNTRQVRAHKRPSCACPRFFLVFSLPDLRELSMLRGMTGYQLTPEDMDFLQTMLEEKMVTKLKVAAAAAVASLLPK